MHRTILAAVAAGLFLARGIFAGPDHTNLEPFLPATVEDAYPIGEDERQVQASLRWDRTGAIGEDDVLAIPRFAMGISRRWQLRGDVPLSLGDAGYERGSGDAVLSALHCFDPDRLTGPVFALAGAVRVPAGKANDGLDTELKGILTYGLGGRWNDRLHVNLTWEHNADPLAIERDDRLVATLGWSRRMSHRASLVVDIVREEQSRRGRETNLVEVGLRRQLSQRRLATLGFGAGFGRESPDLRVHAGLQQEF